MIQVLLYRYIYIHVQTCAVCYNTIIHLYRYIQIRQSYKYEVQKDDITDFRVPSVVILVLAGKCGPHTQWYPDGRLVSCWPLVWQTLTRCHQEMLYLTGCISRWCSPYYFIPWIICMNTYKWLILYMQVLHQCSEHVGLHIFMKTYKWLILCFTSVQWTCTYIQNSENT